MGEVMRLYGNLKIVHHPEKLKALAEGRVTAPIYVRVKPTDLCDHECFSCFYDSAFVGRHLRKREQIPLQKMNEILDDFRDIGVKAITYSGGGEPLIYPDIESIIQRGIDYGIDRSIITNGQKLKDEKAELFYDAHWVRVSANFSNPQQFSQIRNRPESWFGELCDNIQNFAKNKSDGCVLGINFVVHELNYQNLYDSAQLFRDLGVNNIKFTPAWHPDFKSYHDPMKEEALAQIQRAREELQTNDFRVGDTYEADFNFSKVNHRTYPKCYIMQTVPVIAPDQNVYFCHDKTYEKSGRLGSIKDQSFKDLWFSEEAKRKFDSMDPRKNCKCACTNDQKNMNITDIINCAGGHVNFV